MTTRKLPARAGHRAADLPSVWVALILICITGCSDPSSSRVHPCRSQSPAPAAIQITASDEFTLKAGGWNHPADNASGTRVLYMRFPDGRTPVDWFVPGQEIWVVDADGTDPRLVCDDATGRSHDSWVFWIDDERFVYLRAPGDIVIRNLDGVEERTIRQRTIRWKLWDVDENTGALLGEFSDPDPSYSVIESMNPHTGEITHILDRYDLEPFKDELGGSDDPADWDLAGQKFWSPEGNWLHFIVKTGDGNEYYFNASASGTDIRYFGVRPNVMHASLYSARTLFGADNLPGRSHDTVFVGLEGNPRVIAAGTNNHGGISPDRTWIAGESWYGSDPVSVNLYRLHDTTPAATLFEGSLWSYAGPDSGHWAHVDPAFSRDGRRVYVNLALGDGASIVTAYDLSPIMDDTVYYRIKNLATGRYLAGAGGTAPVTLADWATAEDQQWELVPLKDRSEAVILVNRASRAFLVNRPADGALVSGFGEPYENLHKWWLEARGDGGLHIKTTNRDAPGNRGLFLQATSTTSLEMGEPPGDDSSGQWVFEPVGSQQSQAVWCDAS